MPESGGRPEWITSVLLSEVGEPKHRAPNPSRTSWAVLEVGGKLVLTIVVFGAGLTLGAILGGMLLGCGR